MRDSPHDRALAAGSAAVLCGCLLLWLLGASWRMPMMNFGALLVGLAAALVVRMFGRGRSGLADVLILVAGLASPLVALLGERIDGVARWISVGGVTLQPALVMVPLVAIGFASRPNPARLAAVALAATGCALQPDLGAGVMLAFAVGAAAIALRTPFAAAAALFTFAGAAIAALRPVGLLPVPFVELVLPAALAGGAISAALAIAAIILLLLPAYLLRRSATQAAPAAFAGVWAGGLLASLLGPYPTPVLGFGGSAILGYLLSVAALGLSAVAKHRRSSMLPATTGRI